MRKSRTVNPASRKIFSEILKVLFVSVSRDVIIIEIQSHLSEVVVCKIKCIRFGFFYLFIFFQANAFTFFWP